MRPKPGPGPLQQRVYDIIFEADTPTGKFFDVVLLICILCSVGLVALDSIGSIKDAYRTQLLIAEWAFTIIFTIEYILRLWCVAQKRAYALSFYGIVDLLSIIPTWLLLFAIDAQVMLMIRSLRLMRVFRVLKLARYVGESHVLWRALRASRAKITVFLFAVLSIVVIVGTLMFVIEGPEHGFTSIPMGMYWAIVTMTTVGYGDITPETGLGRFIASIIMIMGYGVIAVPTGIVSAELVYAGQTRIKIRTCPSCGAEEHDEEAKFCKHCGANLDGDADSTSEQNASND